MAIKIMFQVIQGWWLVYI